LGGIGSGIITRSIKGDFSRWHFLEQGYNHNGINPINQFSIYLKKINENKEKINSYVLNFNDSKNFKNLISKNNLKKWNFYCLDENNEKFDKIDCGYYSRYPFSWYSYYFRDQNIKLICKQFSPVIKNNYQFSSYPTSVFQYKINHINNEIEKVDCEVSLMFSFGNLLFGMENEINETQFNDYYEDKNIFSLNFFQTLSVFFIFF
jgi:uncharacterized protein (DUF608 family)